MAGLLTIHSRGVGADVNILDGHSWIEYHKTGEPEPKSYGTWPGEGLCENKELNKKTGHVRRQVWLNDEQEKKLLAKIDQYKARGTNGWQFSNPCSGFASDAWQAATGEYLNSRLNGVTSNPSTLKGAISAANHGVSASPSTRAVEALGRAVGAAVTSPVGVRVSAAVEKAVDQQVVNKVVNSAGQNQTPAAPQTRSKNNGIGR
jgi:hypothetical protein